MTAALLRHDAWRPPQDDRFGVGAVLALIAHAILVAGLAFGVNWHTSSPPVVMSAELWSAVPQVAAPAPVAPPPAPAPKVERPVERPQPDPRIEQRRIEAQIAVEKAEREKKRQQELEEKEQERLRQERLKAEKLKEDKAKEDKAKEEKRRADLAAKMREDQLARMRDLTGATGTAAPQSQGTAARDAAPSATYAGRIKARIKPNIVLTGEVLGNPTAEVEIRCAPDGRIIGKRIFKSSGNPLWDDTVLRAIDRTEVLPRDTDGRVPSTMLLIFPRQE